MLGRIDFVTKPKTVERKQKQMGVINAGIEMIYEGYFWQILLRIAPKSILSLADLQTKIN